ncbi:MAG: DUF6483 family protein [Bacteroidota bacterium]|nr:DUF6483 family protein [Bacteroidota bacterium]
MIHRDYIMRMIEQLNKVLAKILFNKEVKQFENALGEIQTSGEKFLGLKWDILNQLSDQDIIAMLKIGGELNVGKTIVTASLFKEEADILETLGKEDESWKAYLKAFSLFVEILMVEKTDEIINKAKEVLQKIDKYNLPVNIEEKRVWFNSLKKNE